MTLGSVATEGGFTSTIVTVLILYMIVLLVLGVVGFLRSRATEEDFYLAGRGQGLLVTVMTIMATFFSSAAILGIPGNVYKDGVAFTLFALNLPVAGVCIYVLGSKIRRMGQKRGFVTQGDMIADYYGDSAPLRATVALAGFFYVILYIVMQIKAGGYLAQVMFPETEPLNFLGYELETFELGATALSLVTMIYVLIGGMRSVAWTDVLQGFLLLGGLILASVATIAALGGMSGFFDTIAKLPSEALSLPGPRGNWNASALLTICIFTSIASIIQPGQWMRLYAARNDRTLKQSSLVFSIVLPSCFLFGIMLVALAGRALYPPEVTAEIQQAHEAVGSFDQIVVVMLKEQLPQMLGSAGVVLLAIILVAILAASMSTADSNLHALSAVLTRDVYDRFIRPGAGEVERAWVGRISIVATTFFALWLVHAMHRNPDYEPLNMIADIMFAAIASACQLLPATIDMLFIRKGTRAGLISGLVAGLLVVFLFTPFPTAILDGLGLQALADGISGSTGLLKNYFDIGFCGLVVNCVIFAVVSVYTKPATPSHIKAFARDLVE